jgi:hypothetical protein
MDSADECADDFNCKMDERIAVVAPRGWFHIFYAEQSPQWLLITSGVIRTRFGAAAVAVCLSTGGSTY